METRPDMVRRGSFSGGFQTDFEEPSNTRFNAPFDRGEHLRNHRPGRPSKIDTDPELHAFIVARIDTTTFSALADQIAEEFLPFIYYHPLRKT